MNHLTCPEYPVNLTHKPDSIASGTRASLTWFLCSGVKLHFVVYIKWIDIRAQNFAWNTRYEDNRQDYLNILCIKIFIKLCSILDTYKKRLLRIINSKLVYIYDLMKIKLYDCDIYLYLYAYYCKFGSEF